MSRYDNQEELDAEVAKIASLSNEVLIHHLCESYAFFRWLDRDMEYDKSVQQIEYHNLAKAELNRRLTRVMEKRV